MHRSPRRHHRAHALARTLAVPLGLTLAAACGDDGGGPLDGPPVDADPTDAVDGPPDGAPITTYAGTISLLETQILAPGNTGALYAQGLTANINFTSSDLVPAPLMEEMAGSPFGCKAWLYTPAQAIAATVGLDEGPVQLSATAGTSPPMIPQCVYTAGTGYTCPHAPTSSSGGTVAIVAAGQTASLTDLDVNYLDVNSLGRYVSITGAARASNNGVFPIVGRPNANSIVFANPAAMAETLPATAMHVNLAAAGPIPGTADPGFLADDVELSFVHTAGGGNHFPNFTAGTPSTVGDDFAMPVAEAAELNALPAGGAPFTIDCGAQCGTATGSVVNIITTDAPVAGLSPYAMPAPVTRRVQVRCATAGVNSITVPAAYAQLLGGATRIQTSFIRMAVLANGPGNVTPIAGHSLVGFTTR